MQTISGSKMACGGAVKDTTSAVSKTLHGVSVNLVAAR